MTAEEQGEYVRMVRVLDMAVRTVSAPLWPLCLPALTLMQEHDRRRRMRPCPMPHCRLASGHRCGCEVRSVRKGLAVRAKVKAAGGEEGRSVLTDQGDSVGQGPRSLQQREAYADRTA